MVTLNVAQDPDDDFDALIGAAAPGEAPVTTLLAEVMAEIADEAAKTPMTFDMRHREGWSITYAPTLTSDRLKKIGEQCRVKGSKDDVMTGKFSALVLASCCIEIHRNGSLVVEDDTSPLLLRSTVLRSMYKTPDQWRAVIAFFGSEADCASHAQGVTSEWGLDPISS